MEIAPDDEGHHRHQPNRLGEMAYSNMKERLIRGAFSPGDKLTIRAVSEMLDVSTTPARDAINRLVIDGALIYSGPKTVIVPHLRLSDLEEITQMRLALEGLAAALSVKAASEATIEELTSTLSDEAENADPSNLAENTFEDASKMAQEYGLHSCGD